MFLLDLFLWFFGEFMTKWCLRSERRVTIVDPTFPTFVASSFERLEVPSFNSQRQHAAAIVVIVVPFRV